MINKKKETKITAEILLELQNKIIKYNFNKEEQEIIQKYETLKTQIILNTVIATAGVINLIKDYIKVKK